MPVEIIAVTGDIVHEAPRVAEASILWLWSGSARRVDTWHDLVRRYQYRPQENLPTNPWLDQVFEVVPGAEEDQLRYLYVFANPDDRRGCSLRQIRDAIHRALERLTAFGVRRMAMTNIPYRAQPDDDMDDPILAKPHEEDGGSRFEISNTSEALEDDDMFVGDRHAARVMIDAIRNWDHENQGRLDNIYLVDLRGDFAPLL